MPFCKYCGKKLEEGEYCGCPDSLSAAAAELEAAIDTPAEEATDPMESYIDPVEDITDPDKIEEDEGYIKPLEEDVPDPLEKTEKKDKKEKKKKHEEKHKPEREKKKPVNHMAHESAPVPSHHSEPFKHDNTAEIAALPSKKKGGYLKGSLLFIGIVLLLILLVLLLMMILTGGYKSPVSKMEKGITRCRSNSIIEAVVPESRINSVKNDLIANGGKWKDITEELDEYLETSRDLVKDSSDYDGKLKAEIKIVDKDKVSGSALKTIRKAFDSIEEEVSKAYKLKLEINYAGENGRFNIYSVKLKGSGWILYADEKTSDKLGMIFRDEIDGCGREIVRVASGYRDPLSVFGWNSVFDMFGMDISAPASSSSLTAEEAED